MLGPKLGHGPNFFWPWNTGMTKPETSNRISGTEKFDRKEDVKLFGYDFRGHTRGTLVVGIAIGGQVNAKR